MKYIIKSRTMAGITDYYVGDTSKGIKLGSDTVYKAVNARYFETKREATAYAKSLK